MAMTLSQKILAFHAGKDNVTAGQLITADLDLVLGNDITSPVAVKEFEKAGFSDVKVHKTRKVWCVVEGVKAESGVASSTRTDR